MSVQFANLYDTGTNKKKSRYSSHQNMLRNIFLTFPVCSIDRKNFLWQELFKCYQMLCGGFLAFTSAFAEIDCDLMIYLSHVNEY